jgi:hypothetical protein
MSEIIDPETLFQDIWSDLDNSMSALENGGNVDMASLDTKVRHFCKIVTGLEPIEAKIYRPKMEQIINHLNTLVDSLMIRKETLNIEIDMVDQRQRAQMAYGNSRLYSETNGE